MVVENERWLQGLKAAVEQGFYKTEAATEEQEPLPVFRARVLTEKKGPWTNETPIDLDLARKGYLESPQRDGSRMIPGLESMARDLRDGGVSLFWGDPPEWGVVSMRDVKKKRLTLARFMYEDEDFWIRGYLAGGVARMVGGTKTAPDDFTWAHRRYGALSWWIENYR